MTYVFLSVMQSHTGDYDLALYVAGLLRALCAADSLLLTCSRNGEIRRMWQDAIAIFVGVRVGFAIMENRTVEPIRCNSKAGIATADASGNAHCL